MYRTLTGFRRLSSNHGLISNRALKGSSNSNLCEISPRCPKNVILTLDPNKFAEKKQQRLNLSNVVYIKPHISLLNQSGLVEAAPLDYDRRRNRKTGDSATYPPDTKAFLYYSVSPEKPRISGELRLCGGLRVASSDDHASFESGSDLLRTDGHPWTRPLCYLPKIFSPLYEKLREEKFVSDDLHRVLSPLISSMSPPFPKYRRSRLYTLNDPFIVDFSKPKAFFFAITEQGMQNLILCDMFTDGRDRDIHASIRPYTGNALARFERSTFPEHKDTRTVVLRFLKIMTPVKCVIPLYDDYIPLPEEGKLHRRSRSRLKWDQAVLWSINIDKPNLNETKYRGLQLLWDA